MKHLIRRRFFFRPDSSAPDDRDAALIDLDDLHVLDFSEEISCVFCYCDDDDSGYDDAIVHTSNKFATSDNADSYASD